ncbi:MAG: NAD-dependent epimerase/dehydratase family protein [Pseudomonadota bacterium]|nr:NAD-dependent epimerase/dehydratase family protein [Pseudomonadota bacterium]
MKLIFFGAGYCSKYILPRLVEDIEIICTHSSVIRSEQFDENFNLKRLTFKEFLKEKKNLLKNVTHIIDSIPPVNDEDMIISNLKDDLKEHSEKLEWFGYFSSTSVYGDYSGKWVDEENEKIPTTIRGINRAKAEESFLKLFKENNLPLHIFRLPGIYGPGRSAVDKILSGNRSVIKKPKHFFSRIHVEDIASAIILSMKKPTPGEIYNLTDDYPCSSNEVMEYASKLLKIKDLDFLNIDNPKVSEKTKDFYRDNKRVSNKKIKKILDWTPKFGTYRLGLKNIFENYSNE